MDVVLVDSFATKLAQVFIAGSQRDGRPCFQDMLENSFWQCLDVSNGITKETSFSRESEGTLGSFCRYPFRHQIQCFFRFSGDLLRQANDERSINPSPIRREIGQPVVSP